MSVSLRVACNLCNELVVQHLPYFHYNEHLPYHFLVTNCSTVVSSLSVNSIVIFTLVLVWLISMASIIMVRNCGYGFTNLHVTVGMVSLAST